MKRNWDIMQEPAAEHSNKRKQLDFKLEDNRHHPAKMGTTIL